jgi:hypothetical protein
LGEVDLRLRSRTHDSIRLLCPRGGAPVLYRTRELEYWELARNTRLEPACFWALVPKAVGARIAGTVVNVRARRLSLQA